MHHLEVGVLPLDILRVVGLGHCLRKSEFRSFVLFKLLLESERQFLFSRLKGFWTFVLVDHFFCFGQSFFLDKFVLDICFC